MSKWEPESRKTNYHGKAVFCDQATEIRLVVESRAFAPVQSGDFRQDGERPVLTSPRRTAHLSNRELSADWSSRSHLTNGRGKDLSTLRGGGRSSAPFKLLL
ncbi:hypothetical protein AOLI_G00096810 [Acnodon oligacanthus]